MTALPSLSSKQLIKVLHGAGFAVIRVKGSHHFLKHEDGRCTIVPVHAGEEIGPGLLAKILRDCKISRDQFMTLL